MCSCASEIKEVGLGIPEYIVQKGGQIYLDFEKSGIPLVVKTQASEAKSVLQKSI